MGTALWRTLGWESKWKVGQRGRRGCVVHSLFLLLRDERDSAYVGIEGSRMDLSATTKVWIHNGGPHTVVLLFPLCSLKDEFWSGGWVSKCSFHLKMTHKDDQVIFTKIFMCAESPNRKTAFPFHSVVENITWEEVGQQLCWVLNLSETPFLPFIIYEQYYEVICSSQIDVSSFSSLFLLRWCFNRWVVPARFRGGRNMEPVSEQA